jgi:hypothetical protein
MKAATLFLVLLVAFIAWTVYHNKSHHPGQSLY